MKPDSYIFDMDGTLWDAVDSYAKVWNAAIAELGVPAPEVTRARLAPLMGTPLSQIYEAIIGNRADRQTFTAALRRHEAEMMPKLGGRVYPGVEDTLRALKDDGAQLFMVSNCSPSGIPNFLEYTGFDKYITDFESIGMNGLEKDANMRRIADVYQLKTPVYVGDTQGDCDHTHRAGMPFVWARYGFGKNVHGYDFVISEISDLIKLRNNERTR